MSKLLYVFTKPSSRVGSDTRLVFKGGLTGFDLDFSFSWIGCLTKASEPSLSYYLSIAGVIPFQGY